jgi:hypothetical protein
LVFNNVDEEEALNGNDNMTGTEQDDLWAFRRYAKGNASARAAGVWPRKHIGKVLGPHFVSSSIANFYPVAG